MLELYLERIARLDPPVNAVVTLDAERALAAARAADDAVARGEALGPLHGLPMTIKDAIEVGGVRSTGGAVELRDHVPASDAAAVARLRAAGAIVFGKTNLPRWSGDMQTYNEIFGTTNNPWATRPHDRRVLGRRGGRGRVRLHQLRARHRHRRVGAHARRTSAACSASSPASASSPNAATSTTSAAALTDADINVFGPIARSAEDLDLLLSVLAGPEPERAEAWRIALPPPRHADLTGYRIGVWFEEQSCPLDHELRDVLRATVDSLADAGVAIEEAHPPVDFAEQVGLFNRMIVAAISPSLPDDHADATSGSHRAWLRAEEERARLRRVWAEWFELVRPAAVPRGPAARVPARPHRADARPRPRPERRQGPLPRRDPVDRADRHRRASLGRPAAAAHADRAAGRRAGGGAGAARS